MTRRWKTVAIVGVGLIGGSIGLALRRRGITNSVVGIGRRIESLRVAEQLGAITSATLDLSEGVQDADLIIVCTPVNTIPEFVKQAAQNSPAQALFTDVGSTKQSITTSLAASLPRQVRFIGSHPLAGSEKQGAAEADPDLLVNRTVVITPTRRNTQDDRTEIQEFWELLGARVRTMSPAAHDRALAATSHLPHAIAAALADCLTAGAVPLTATGFRDTTRIAAGDPELWTQILLDNRHFVLQALEPFDRSLALLRTALTTGNRAQLKRTLSKAKMKRDALGS